MISRTLAASVTLATLLGFAMPSLATSTASVRAVFARHDPERRVDHTSIKRLGTIRVGRSRFAIYFLNYTNPVSRHGQQRIAVVKDGSAFIGSQQCVLADEGHIRVERDRVVVSTDLGPSVIRFGRGQPVPDQFFCGEENGWEHGI